MMKIHASPQLAANVLVALRAGPMTKVAFLQRRGLSKTHPGYHLTFSRLHEFGKVRVSGWNRNKGGLPSPIYALQTDPPTPDAPRPVRRTKDEQRRLEAETRREAAAQRREIERDDPGAVPFEQRWVSVAEVGVARPPRAVASVFDLGR